MSKCDSFSRQNKSSALAGLIQPTRRSCNRSQCSTNHGDLVESALFRSISTLDATQVSSFLVDQAHFPQKKALLLGFQQSIGNQAVQSMLAGMGAPSYTPNLPHAARDIPRENPPDVIQADDEALGQLPQQDSATIVCDGNGGYRVSLGWAATATCGIGDCVRGHEQSHAADWQRRFPNGCKNSDGTPKPDGTQVPTGGSGYRDFLRQSECKAYTGEIPCGERLLQTASPTCKPIVENQLKTWRQRQKAYCSGGC